MREIAYQTVVETVSRLVQEASCLLDKKVADAIQESAKSETSILGKRILDEIYLNQKIAAMERVPMCQDTGLAVFFVEIGNQVFLNFKLEDAINAGVHQGYLAGFLRKSVVKHPIDRQNTLDNTPAILHVSQTVGDSLLIRFAPKGAGSENMSRLKMLTPGEGIEGIVAFVKETVLLAGGKACPPLILGIGIGGDFEVAPLLAKRAVLREIDDSATHPIDHELEIRLKDEVNRLGVGPMGLGGITTCLAVKVESAACHIASLPVAVNIQCHAARHKEAIL